MSVCACVKERKGEREKGEEADLVWLEVFRKAKGRAGKRMRLHLWRGQRLGRHCNGSERERAGAKERKKREKERERERDKKRRARG